LKPGYAVVNRITAEKPHSIGEVIKAFKTRSGLIEGLPGFRGLLVLASREAGEVLVVTLWDSRDDFESWVRGEGFRRAHERARARRLEGVESSGLEYEVVDYVVDCM